MATHVHRCVSLVISRRRGCCSVSNQPRTAQRRYTDKITSHKTSCLIQRYTVVYIFDKPPVSVGRTINAPSNIVVVAAIANRRASSSLPFCTLCKYVFRLFMKSFRSKCVYVLQASEQASTETGDRDEKKKGENQQNSTHGHNLRDIFINDALCSPNERRDAKR